MQSVKNGVLIAMSVTVSDIDVSTAFNEIIQTVNPDIIHGKIRSGSSLFTEEEIIFILFHPDSFAIAKLERPPSNVSGDPGIVLVVLLCKVY